MGQLLSVGTFFNESLPLSLMHILLVAVNTALAADWFPAKLITPTKRMQ